MNAGEFFGATILPFRRPGFAGRLRRRDFWPFVFLIYAGGQVLTLPFLPRIMAEMQRLMGTIAAGAAGAPAGSRAVPPGFALPGILPMMAVQFAWLLLCVPFYAGAIVRRLHDTGRSGWWAAPQGLLLLTGMTAMTALVRRMLIYGGTPPMAGFLLLFANNIVYLGWTILLIVFAAQEGTRGANRYGPDPIARA